MSYQMEKRILISNYIILIGTTVLLAAFSYLLWDKLSVTPENVLQKLDAIYLELDGIHSEIEELNGKTNTGISLPPLPDEE